MNASTIHRFAAWLFLFPAALLVLAARPASSAQVEAQRKSPVTPAAVSAPAATEMPELVRRYEVDQRSVGGFYDLPWSFVRFQRMESLNRDWVEQLQASDFDR